MGGCENIFGILGNYERSFFFASGKRNARYALRKFLCEHSHAVFAALKIYGGRIEMVHAESGGIFTQNEMTF